MGAYESSAPLTSFIYGLGGQFDFNDNSRWVLNDPDSIVIPEAG